MPRPQTVIGSDTHCRYFDFTLSSLPCRHFTPRSSLLSTPIAVVAGFFCRCSLVHSHSYELTLSLLESYISSLHVYIAAASLLQPYIVLVFAAHLIASSLHRRCFKHTSPSPQVPFAGASASSSSTLPISRPTFPSRSFYVVHLYFQASSYQPELKICKIYKMDIICERHKKRTANLQL